MQSITGNIVTDSIQSRVFHSPGSLSSPPGDLLVTEYLLIPCPALPSLSILLHPIPRQSTGGDSMRNSSSARSVPVDSD